MERQIGFESGLSIRRPTTGQQMITLRWHQDVPLHGPPEIRTGTFRMKWADPIESMSKPVIGQLWERGPELGIHPPTQSRMNVEASFEKEREAFNRLIVEAIRNPGYANKYIAVVDGLIQGSDYNKENLARRIYKKFGYRPIYVGKVTRTKRTIELSSPE